MTRVESRRHLTQFYLTLAFVALFCFGVAALTLSNAFDHFQNIGGATQNDWLAILFSFGILFIGLYTIFAYARNCPNIIVDAVEISFNKQIYYWKDIRAIELTGYQPFYFLFTYPQPGARLTFKDGGIRYIYDNLYSNTYLLKWFIQQAIINKRTPIERPVPHIDLNELNQQKFEVFKRSQLLSANALIPWFGIGITMLVLLKSKENTVGGVIVVAVFEIALFCAISYGMNYFCLSEKYLVIKNNNFFWQKKVYHLKEIREVELESLGKGQMGVRIQTKDFRNNLYPATLLTDKQLGLLLKALRLKGVPVSGY